MTKSEMKGEEFRALRTGMLMSPTDFASKLGISACSVYFYETNKRPIPLSVAEWAKKLADIDAKLKV